MPASRRGHWLFRLTLFASFIGVCGVLVLWWLRGVQLPPPTFDGDSTKLKHTAIVPMLDSPIPVGKSVVWCSSMQLAWGRLRDAAGPFRLIGAEDIADRLDLAAAAEVDLEPGSYFAAAGRADEVADKIRTGMRERFPDVQPPELSPDTDTAVAFAYLRAGVRFDPPFPISNQPMRFTAGSGEPSDVKAFGLPKANRRSSRPVQVLYCSARKQQTDYLQADEFGLDLSPRSRPYQIILAKVPPQATLAATLAELDQKMDAYLHEHLEESLSWVDSLMVPFVVFRLSHHFAELEGGDKRIQGGRLDGGYISRALQTIDFRLDPSGSQVTSAGHLAVKKLPTYYHFDRPFLIVMRKRGATRPFFVMWVENAELLGRP